MNQFGGQNIPPPPPRGAGRGGRGGGGRRDNRRERNSGGRSGRGGFHNNGQNNNNFMNPNFSGGGRGGNVIPPPPPPPPNHRQHGGGGRHGNNFGNNFPGRHNGRGGRGRDDGRGRGHYRGAPMGNMNGRGPHGATNGHQPQHPNYHHQQQPPSNGHLHPGPSQQQNYIPPPPPRSNFGPNPNNMHPSGQMIRNGPPPPPPPPRHQYTHRNQPHIHQQGIIPPPPPKQQPHNHVMAPGVPQLQVSINHHQQQQQQFIPQQQMPSQQNNYPATFAQQQSLAPLQQIAISQQQLQLQQQHQSQQLGTQYPMGQQVQAPQQTASKYQMVQSLQPQQQQQHLLQTYQLPQQQQQSTATLSTSKSSTDPEKIAENWTTHKSPTGIDYFYNIVTQKSTYDKPTCLSQGTSSTTHAAVTTTSVNNNEGSHQRGWTQHTDKASGKVYYYNGITTTWDKPDGFDNKNNHEQSVESQEPAKKKQKKENNSSSSLYNNKAEAIAAFKGLLLAKDISPIMKWHDVMKICSSDNRWNACSSVGERKQALAEYQTKRSAELKEQKRQEKVRVKDAFMTLLTEVLPSVKTFSLSSNTRFEDIRDSLSKDDRFYAVEDEETRHEIYFDFVEELRKREERQKRGRKREAKDNFLAFLKNREEIGSLTFASTWSSFILTLSAKDKADAHFAVSPAMSDSDRQLYFADYVLDLNAKEDEKQRRIHDARRRAEKAQRNAYREALRSMAKEGKIIPSSRWRNIEEELSVHKSFGPVNDQDKNKPRDMFEDFVYEWADDYRRDKSFLSSLMESSKDVVINADSKFDDFKAMILKEAEYSSDAYANARRVINEEDPVSSAKLFFDEMVLKAKNNDSMIQNRRGPYGRRAAESSEDEGEIVEDEEEEGEVIEKTEKSGEAEKQDDSINAIDDGKAQST